MRAKKRIFTTIAGSPGAYKKWNEWEEGDVFVGKYIKRGTDQFRKDQWWFEVESAEFSTPHDDFQPGKTVCLNSCGTLDKVMEEQEFGTIVRIVYNGTSPMKKGTYKGKDAHSLEIGVAQEGEDRSFMEQQNEDDDI